MQINKMRNRLKCSLIVNTDAFCVKTSQIEKQSDTEDLVGKDKTE